MKFVLAAASSLGIGASLPADASAQEASAQYVELAALQVEADEACRVALQTNTIEALEEYLNKYPDASTSCRALAAEALGQFAPTSGGAVSGRLSGVGYSG